MPRAAAGATRREALSGVASLFATEATGADPTDAKFARFLADPNHAMVEIDRLIVQREGLPGFMRLGWGTVEQEGTYKSNWHVNAIGEHLEAVSAGEIKRLIIMVPPRHMKPVFCEEIVTLKDRGRVQLKEVRVGDLILTHRGRFRRVLAVHENGDLPTCIVHTSCGRRARMAPDHPVLSAAGWKAAGLLTNRDTVAAIAPAENGFDHVLVPDQVDRVEAAPSGRCICLSVDEDCSFTVNDIAVHNSLSVAVMWPAWDWIDNPWRRFLFSSYAHNLSIRDSVRCRSVINSPWYKARWGDRFKLTGDQNTKIRFTNDKTGQRLSTSVGGQLTGEGGDIVACFPADQVVATEHGPVPIGQLVEQRMQVRVWSTCPKTGDTTLEPITGWHRNPGRPIYEVGFSDGAAVRCTGDHGIWTLNRGKVPALDLRASDLLPHAPAFDPTDDVLVDPVSGGKCADAVEGVVDFPNLVGNQLGVRMIDASVPVIPLAMALSNITPGLAAPDLLHGAGLHTKGDSDLGCGAAGRSDFDGLRLAQLRAWSLLVKEQCAVPSRVGDILRPTAIGEVLQPVVMAVSVEMPCVLPFLLRSDKGGENHLMNVEVERSVIAAGVEDAISPAIVWSFEDSAGLAVRAVIPDHDPILAADPAVAGDAVAALKAGYRQPSFIRFVGHEQHTFCLSVPDKNTFWCSVKGVPCILVSNCDDPNNALKAESQAEREKTNRWWDEAMSTRLSNPEKGAFVIIQQRLNEQDLVGHVLGKHGVIQRGGEYYVLCLPAEYEPDHPQRWFRDPRKEEGELLWPSHVGRATVESLKMALGPFASAGQLQQRPTAREGGYFKRHWFRVVATAASDTEWLRSWDLAASEAKLTKSDPDYTAGVLIGFSPSRGKWIIGDARRFRVGPGEVRQRIKATAEADRARYGYVRIVMPQDPGQAGKDQGQSYGVLLAAFSLEIRPVTGKKVERATPLAGQAELGNVEMLDTGRETGDDNWNRLFLDEMTGFPTGSHDDWVDATTSGFNSLTGGTDGLMAYYQRLMADKMAKEAAAAAAGPRPGYSVVSGTTSNLAHASMPTKPG